MSTLEKCKNLLEEVVSELSSSPASTSSPNSVGTPGTSGTSSLTSSSVAAKPQPTSVSSVQDEHRRLFGFNPRAKARYHPYSQRRQRNNQPKPKRVSSWTRNFVCLSKTNATSPPTASEYFHLRNAGLGERKITLDLPDGALDVDLKLKEIFPKLENSGGYSLMRTFERGLRTLTNINGPYSCERIKDAMGQGKIFIRPLQLDLSMDVVVPTSGNDVRVFCIFL